MWGGGGLTLLLDNNNNNYYNYYCCRCYCCILRECNLYCFLSTERRGGGGGVTFILYLYIAICWCDVVKIWASNRWLQK